MSRIAATVLYLTMASFAGQVKSVYDDLRENYLLKSQRADVDKIVALALKEKDGFLAVPLRCVSERKPNIQNGAIVFLFPEGANREEKLGFHFMQDLELASGKPRYYEENLAESIATMKAVDLATDRRARLSLHQEKDPAEKERNDARYFRGEIATSEIKVGVEYGLKSRQGANDKTIYSIVSAESYTTPKGKSVHLVHCESLNKNLKEK